jgi:hypothetical protein
MQGIDLMSELGADTTIIDGYGVGGPVIILVDDLDSTTKIDGFTIRNGSAQYYYGAISCYYNSSPMISNCVIKENFGPGIACVENSSAIICDNTIAFNNSWGIEGAGIHCSNSTPTIYNNWIHDNIICGDQMAVGGGIYCWNSYPVIYGNVISYNSAASAIPGFEAGGGIFCYNSTGIITRNTITMNSANLGGGIFCQGTSDPMINYNNIMHNYRHGLYNWNLYTIITAEHNWWGDATGPYHPTLNPGGLGDTVSNNVDFDPWLNYPVGIEERPITESVEGQAKLGATILIGPLLIPKGKKCRVLDIAGRVVDPSKIQPGIYFLEIDGEVVRKVVKIR